MNANRNVDTKTSFVEWVMVLKKIVGYLVLNLMTPKHWISVLKLDYVICHMVSRLTNLVMLWSQS